MKRASRNVAAGCATVAVLMGAATGTANAYYLGYGNGDPGNWDFWTEQYGGPRQKTQIHGHHAATHHHHTSALKEKKKHS